MSRVSIRKLSNYGIDEGEYSEKWTLSRQFHPIDTSAIYQSQAHAVFNDFQMTAQNTSQLVQLKKAITNSINTTNAFKRGQDLTAPYIFLSPADNGYYSSPPKKMKSTTS
jgi:hypothetical protein